MSEQLYGSETAKAVANFPISGERVPLPVGHWQARIKGAAAQANAKLGKLDAERITHWIAQGAQPTDRVLRFLNEAGIAKSEAKNNPEKAKPGKRAQERAAEKAQKIADAAEAAASAE